MTFTRAPEIVGARLERGRRESPTTNVRTWWATDVPGVADADALESVPPREQTRNVTDSFDTLELTACSDLARNAAAGADSGLVLEQESLKIPDPGDGSSGITIVARIRGAAHLRCG